MVWDVVRKKDCDDPWTRKEINPCNSKFLANIWIIQKLALDVNNDDFTGPYTGAVGKM